MGSECWGELRRDGGHRPPHPPVGHPPPRLGPEPAGKPRLTGRGGRGGLAARLVEGREAQFLLDPAVSGTRPEGFGDIADC